MLKSYEGMVENGQIRWLAEQPMGQPVRVMVTVLEEPVEAVPEGAGPQLQRRMTSPLIAGKGKTLGDLVSPSVDDMDTAASAWLDADLAGDLPEYDWGEAGIPVCQPVRFVPGEGLVVDEVN
jgi:hypothetical protein